MHALNRKATIQAKTTMSILLTPLITVSKFGMALSISALEPTTEFSETEPTELLENKLVTVLALAAPGSDSRRLRCNTLARAGPSATQASISAEEARLSIHRRVPGTGIDDADPGEIWRPGEI